MAIGAHNKRYLNFFLDLTTILRLDGRSKFNTAGDKQAAAYEVLLNSEQGAQDNLQKYRFYVGYDSMMAFSEDICVGPQKLYGDLGTGECDVNDKPKLSFGGQGAPLTVSKLEVIPRSERIDLILTVENKGAGTVGDVSVRMATLGGKALSCEWLASPIGSPLKTTFGSEKKRELLCSRTLVAQSSYSTPVLVELNYYYSISFEDKLIIRATRSRSSAILVS